MNWLAHLFLSNHTIEHQLANILADPLKGKSWKGASSQIEHGILTHKIIDSFTDSHPKVSKSKHLLTSKGYLKGVVVDIAYDYFLSLHWSKFCHIEKKKFIDTFHLEALEAISHYPQKAQGVITRLIETKQLHSYSQLQGVKDAFRRIDRRLSSRALKKDNALRYFELIQANTNELEADFLTFFPQLMHHTQKRANLNTTSHWKESIISQIDNRGTQ